MSLLPVLDARTRARAVARARLTGVLPVDAALDKPVYGCQAGPFQQRTWDAGVVDELYTGMRALPGRTMAYPAYNVFGNVVGNPLNRAFNPLNFFYPGSPFASPPGIVASPGYVPRVASYASLY